MCSSAGSAAARAAAGLGAGGSADLAARDAELERADDGEVDLRGEGAALEEARLVRLRHRLVLRRLRVELNLGTPALRPLLVERMRRGLEQLLSLHLLLHELLAQALILLGDRVELEEAPGRARLV